MIFEVMRTGLINHYYYSYIKMWLSLQQQFREEPFLFQNKLYKAPVSRVLFDCTQQYGMKWNLNVGAEESQIPIHKKLTIKCPDTCDVVPRTLDNNGLSLWEEIWAHTLLVTIWAGIHDNIICWTQCVWVCVRSWWLHCPGPPNPGCLCLWS